MKILVFGGSGLTGHEVLEQGLRRGYQLTAFVRDPSKLKIRNARLDHRIGNVANLIEVLNAVPGHDAVVSALGASTPFKRDPALVEGIRNIVSAMEQLDIKRFVYESFLGVKENRDELGFFINNVLSRLLKNVIADHEEKERIIKNSKLDWTIVRPPKLTNGPFTGNYRTGEHITSRSLILKISRADVAAFMLDLLASKQYIRQSPRILS